jgi:hypothetical protein
MRLMAKLEVREVFVFQSTDWDCIIDGFDFSGCLVDIPGDLLGWIGLASTADAF